MFESKFERLYQSLGVSNDSELARALGITPPSVASARQKKQVPIGWIEKASALSNFTLDWLYYGRGPMRPGEEAKPPDTPAQSASTSKVAVPSEAASERCARLEQELTKKNQQFDSTFEKLVEMGQDAMRLTEEVGRLRLENLKLTHKLDTADRMCREYAAALKETGAADPIFDEQQIIPSNSQFGR